MVVISSSSKPNSTRMDETLKKRTIQEVFQTMDYGKSFENVNKALDWMMNKEKAIFAYIENIKETPNGTPVQIKSQVDEEVFCTVHVPEIDTIKKILLKCNGKVKWMDTKPTLRAKILKKLAEEIEKNGDVLCQIEIVTRGILGKDTKCIAVPLLAQYFHYYSAFAVSHRQDNINWKPEGIVAGVISNTNALSNVGLILAPALAAGYNIVLQTGTKLAPAVLSILDLAKKVGIPEEVIRLIPSDDGELLPYLSSENVMILSLFVDLHNEKYLGINNYNKKILNLASYKTPLIVFDNADLDSASASLVEAAWTCQGLLPWAVDIILVQENVFDTFLDKLKIKLRTTKVGPSHDKMVDVALLSAENVKKLCDLTEQAKSLGIDVFQAGEGGNAPTLLIGAKVHTNMILDKKRTPVTVLPFRTIDEAVNLANNTRQGLAASVWTENIGTANEVTKKLKVSNVWINTYGQTLADISLAPMRDSGMGYCGGKEGFDEYVQFKKISETCTSALLPSKLNSSVITAINNARKSQENWAKTSRLSKAKLLQDFAEYVDSNRKTLGLNLSELWLDHWINTIYMTVTASHECGYSQTQSGFNVSSFREPRGVIAIETKNVDTHNVKLIIGALFEGNSVVLLNESEPTQAFYKELCRRLPNSILTVVPYNLDNVATAAGHKGLSAYLGHGANPVFSVLPVNEARIFTNISGDQMDVYARVTYCKNVWSNIGKSSTCTL
ncbi:hypothetical protein NQ318_012415 [Aromia moschata]|uniref:Aldehyde dehydrogenase domain-containing protein n=1 Tax=Aromia moschata TaxID=1265417 RepID=A0AAV8Y4A3_9CUCU|nr:hypothetical protein NQ318_012415 [Aromia moschata]